MRKALAEREGDRARYVGVFERYGTMPAFKGPDLPTVVFKDVCDALSGEPVSDHLWFKLIRAFAALHLQPGDRVAFDARVKAYKKGYLGRREGVYKPAETDYKLSHPTRVEKQEASAAST